MEIKKPAILGLCLALGACGQINHNVDGGVNVNLNIDFSELEKYFIPVCKEEMPDATDEQIDDCVNLKIGEFLDGGLVIKGLNTGG